MSVISELAEKHARDSEANEGCELGTMVGDFEAFGRELLEKCCATECAGCREGLPLSQKIPRVWLHEHIQVDGAAYRCEASRLRALGE